jgi:hypothetical protein
MAIANLRAVRSDRHHTWWIAEADAGYVVSFTAPRNAEGSPHWRAAIERMVERARPVRMAWPGDVWDDASAEREV